CPSQNLGVGSVADDLVSLEVVGQDPARGCAGELVGISVDDHNVVTGLVHVGRQLRTHPSAADYEELQGKLIIGRPRARPAGSPGPRGRGQVVRPLLLGFGRLRFPFTFMGLMALGIGVWVAAYLAGHRSLDPVSQAIAGATVLISWGLGLYVLIRRVRRGPQH